MSADEYTPTTEQVRSAYSYDPEADYYDPLTNHTRRAGGTLMPTYQFQPVRTSRRKFGNCPVCGKRVTRSRTFEHTVNPFNRNDDGTVRTYDEVRAAVNAEADVWVPNFTHWSCIPDAERSAE